jgi:SAM-dependent methyltransferase
MKQDRIKWNEKFRNEDYPEEPAGPVKRFYHLASGKKALDIAAGKGRNTIFLSRMGFSVDAVDISDVGLAGFAGRDPKINAICADLDNFDIPPGRYDLILNIKFLNRRLFPSIQEGLKPGGILIFHTLMVSDRVRKTQEHNREYLLRKNELLHAFLGMRVVYYEENSGTGARHSDETATLVGIRE